MRKAVIVAATGAVAFALSSSQPASPQADVDQQLGNVHFQTSCNEVAQRCFDRAMLERGLAKEALAAFEATKANEPNRFRGFAGAAKAAEKLGDRNAAKANYERMIALIGTPNSDRADVKAALRFLGKS